MTNYIARGAAADRHLDEEEIVAAIDGELGADRTPHLVACRACRETVAGLANVMTDAAAVDVPEPSPLFWGHLSTRVRDGIAEPGPDRPGLFDWLRSPAAASSLVTAALLIAIVLYRPVVRHSGASGTVTGPSASVVGPGSGPASSTALDEDADSDEAWGLVRALADDVVWEDAHDAGISARPGAADGMAMELTASEQHELAQLLHDELERAGA